MSPADYISTLWGFEEATNFCYILSCHYVDEVHFNSDSLKVSLYFVPVIHLTAEAVKRTGRYPTAPVSHHNHHNIH